MTKEFQVFHICSMYPRYCQEFLKVRKGLVKHCEIVIRKKLWKRLTVMRQATNIVKWMKCMENVLGSCYSAYLCEIYIYICVCVCVCVVSKCFVCVCTCSPFDSAEKMRPLSVSRQSVSSRKSSVYSWTAPSTPSFTEKYFIVSIQTGSHTYSLCKSLCLTWA